MRHEWVAASRLRDHISVERICVVGAQQPPGRSFGERHIEKGLVTLAFDQLRGTAARPDRLTDASQTATWVLAHEVVPSGDDASRIVPHVGHVGEVHGVGIPAETLPQQVDLFLAHHHERGLVGRQPIADERERSGDEPGFSGVHQGLMAEGDAAGHSRATTNITHSLSDRHQNAPVLCSPRLNGRAKETAGSVTGIVYPKRRDLKRRDLKCLDLKCRCVRALVAPGHSPPRRCARWE